MSPAPISNRGLVVGGTTGLGAVALPALVVEAVVANVPMAFDPAAFIEDLLATGHRVAQHQPVRLTGDPDEDLGPTSGSIRTLMAGSTEPMARS